VNHQLRVQVVGAVGIDAARYIADTLTFFSVPQAEREHALYPMVLTWLAGGIRGVEISVADLMQACSDLRRKHPDAQLGAGIVSALAGFTRTAALRRREESERRVTEDEARARKPVASVMLRSRDAIDAVVDEMLSNPKYAPYYSQKKVDAVRLCAELRQVGRSPSELPWNWDEWPATYLPQLGPRPMEA